MAGGADEVKVPRVAVGRLEARAPFPEIDFARDAGTDHPLQRAVHRRAPDARRLATDEVEEIVRADVAFLAQKHLQNAIAFAGALTTCGTQAGEIGKRTVHENW